MNFFTNARRAIIIWFMNPSGYQIRRATVDDLQALRKLWQETMLPGSQLEKRLTEFQVVLDPTGEMLGAVGLQIAGTQAHLHSEAFLRPELEEEVRPPLWERLQVVAQNHGLARIWTQEEAPFWQHYAGFKPISTAELNGLPVTFTGRKAPWISLKLRDIPVMETNLEKELDFFRQAQQEEIERMLQQARQVKRLITGFAILVLIGVLVWGITFLLHHHIQVGR